MSTIADTALRSVVGLIVVTAMFVAIWIARDSSARTAAQRAEHAAQPTALNSARSDRVPVIRTSIPREQLHELQASPLHDAPRINRAR